MAKKVRKIKEDKCDLLYFINNLLCMMSSVLYMLFISITSIAIFPVVQQTQEFTDDVMLETLVKADMFVIRSIAMLFIVVILFHVINYMFFRKKNKTILWGLIIVSGLSLIINAIRVLILYI